MRRPCPRHHAGRLGPPGPRQAHGEPRPQEPRQNGRRGRARRGSQPLPVAGGRGERAGGGVRRGPGHVVDRHEVLHGGRRLRRRGRQVRQNRRLPARHDVHREMPRRQRVHHGLLRQVRKRADERPFGVLDREKRLHQGRDLAAGPRRGGRRARAAPGARRRLQAAEPRGHVVQGHGLERPLRLLRLPAQLLRGGRAQPAEGGRGVLDAAAGRAAERVPAAPVREARVRRQAGALGPRRGQAAARAHRGPHVRPHVLGELVGHRPEPAGRARVQVRALLGADVAEHVRGRLRLRARAPAAGRGEAVGLRDRAGRGHAARRLLRGTQRRAHVRRAGRRRRAPARGPEGPLHGRGGRGRGRRGRALERQGSAGGLGDGAGGTPQLRGGPARGRALGLLPAAKNGGIGPAPGL
mmetsp:Transcript_1468/g.4424  ORF Transcript_1468/g.4424 Transcript_1468/m.4424 type:complete len:410 (+) Transcript_1468:192-1421(+)